jgi:hypothetical protein
MWKKVVLAIIIAIIAKTCIDLLDEPKSDVRIFSVDELKQMTTEKNLYLSILGKKIFLLKARFKTRIK